MLRPSEKASGASDSSLIAASTTRLCPVRVPRLTTVPLLAMALVAMLCASFAAASQSHAARAQPASRNVACRGPGARGCDLVMRLARTTGRASAEKTELSPADFHSAYDLPPNALSPLTVAIVNPYDSSTVDSDLARFSKRFAIRSCGPANGCFRKVNQQGAQAPLPTPDNGFGAEADLAVETVHGICQNCRILLVEASSTDNGDLAAAVDTAARLGAKVISTSYTLAEPLDAVALAAHYEHPGVVITAAAGDHGYGDGPQFPASIPGVVAVGGTHLEVGGNGQYVRESAWSSSGLSGGSGCSAKFPAASWQLPASNSVGCAGQRTIADLAADADPDTGELVYVQGQLMVGGGTSLASPLIGGVYALAGGVLARTPAPSLPYAHPGALHDVSIGTTGYCPPSHPLLCHASRGYDAPTGAGTPAGLTAFGGGSFLESHHPGVVVAAGNRTLRIGAAGSARFSIRNTNGFPVDAVAELRSAHPVRDSGSHRVTASVLFATGTVSLSAHGRRTITLKLSRGHLAALRRLHRVGVTLTFALHDRRGATATVRVGLVLVA